VNEDGERKKKKKVAKCHCGSSLAGGMDSSLQSSSRDLEAAFPHWAILHQSIAPPSLWANQDSECTFRPSRAGNYFSKCCETTKLMDHRSLCELLA